MAVPETSSPGEVKSRQLINTLDVDHIQRQSGRIGLYSQFLPEGAYRPRHGVGILLPDLAQTDGFVRHWLSGMGLSESYTHDTVTARVLRAGKIIDALAPGGLLRVVLPAQVLRPYEGGGEVTPADHADSLRKLCAQQAGAGAAMEIRVIEPDAAHNAMDGAGSSVQFDVTRNETRLIHYVNPDTRRMVGGDIDSYWVPGQDPYVAAENLHQGLGDLALRPGDSRQMVWEAANLIDPAGEVDRPW